MKKALFIIGITTAILLGLAFLFKTSGILRWHNCPGAANEPGIKTGSYFWVSSLKKPGRFDFITFERTGYADYPEANGLTVYRLCGLPGDTLLLKDGILFINGKNADKDLNLFNEYKVSLSGEIAKVNHKIQSIDPGDGMPGPGFAVLAIRDDYIIANLTTEFVQTNKLTCMLCSNDMPDVTDRIGRQWGRPWSIDNFGPLVIPQDSFFVLGDNRHNALDSRFTGFVARSAIKGTVLRRESGTPDVKK